MRSSLSFPPDSFGSFNNITSQNISTPDPENLIDNAPIITSQHSGDCSDQLQSPDSQSSTNWKFADVGNIGLLSRDGSIHATDEVINSVTHLAASMLSLLGTALLISGASAQGEPWKIVSFSIYGFSLILMFISSTMHHSISSSPKVELILRKLDYIAIYPLIAGSFTPMCLVFYHDSTVGWSFFGVIWLCSIWGIMITICLFEKMPKWISMTMYITLGWIGSFMAKWLLAAIGIGGFILFIIGGIFYTVGGYIFTTENPNPIPGKFGFHEIWHIAVMLGAGSHWCIMYFYVLPWEPHENQA